MMDHLQHERPFAVPASLESTARGGDPRTVDQALLSGTTDDFGFGVTRQSGDPILGAEVDGVRIVRLLGEGGMGRVYEGLGQGSANRVAVKFVRPDTVSASSGRRLEREARVLAALEHPSIACVYAAGLHRVADGRLLPYMILEYVPEGRPITEWCRDQRLDERSRVQMLLEVCEAVAHAHERNVVHRDLKPGNVLVDASGNPKLVDFGVAAWSSPMATTISAGARVVGTPAYMSPEQREGGNVDIRSDIYSLGVLAAELVTEEPPLRAQLALATRHDQLARVIRRCLEIDADSRYASVRDFANALCRCRRLGPDWQLQHGRLVLLVVVLALEVLVCTAFLLRGRFVPAVSEPLLENAATKGHRPSGVE